MPARRGRPAQYPQRGRAGVHHQADQARSGAAVHTSRLGPGPPSCPSHPAQLRDCPFTHRGVVRLTSLCLLSLSPAALPEVEELWIGLNDLKLQMNFEWSDGSLVSFTHWHPFEPNNFRDSLEDCVTIWGPVRAPSPQPPGASPAEGCPILSPCL